MSDLDPFASVVTAKDVYDATRQTQQEVRAVLGRLDALEREHADIRARLTAVERWRYALPLTGVSAVIAAIGAVLAALLG